MMKWLDERPYYTRALKALDAAHAACLGARNATGEVLGMSHGSFSGVNEALGIVDSLEQENGRLRAVITTAAEAIERGSTSAPILEILRGALTGRQTDPT